MNNELEIKEYLKSLTFQLCEDSATAIDSLGNNVSFIEIKGDGENKLPDQTLLHLLIDDIIHKEFPDEWIELFVKNKSTFGLFRETLKNHHFGKQDC